MPQTPKQLNVFSFAKVRDAVIDSPCKEVREVVPIAEIARLIQIYVDNENIRLKKRYKQPGFVAIKK